MPRNVLSGIRVISVKKRPRDERSIAAFKDDIPDGVVRRIDGRDPATSVGRRQIANRGRLRPGRKEEAVAVAPPVLVGSGYSAPGGTFTVHSEFGAVPVWPCY